MLAKALMLTPTDSSSGLEPGDPCPSLLSSADRSALHSLVQTLAAREQQGEQETMDLVLFAETCFQSASQLVILANNKAETQETTIRDTRDQQYDNEKYDNEL